MFVSTILDVPAEESIELPGPVTTPLSIKIIHHPDSGVNEPTVIPLESQDAVPYEPEHRVFMDQPYSKPWAPFRSREDFEYAETAIKGLLNKDTVNRQLLGLQGRWAESTKITFRSYADMEKSLAAARQYGVQVCHSFHVLQTPLVFSLQF
jgi:hypothetical protein